jgi:mannose-6-phosphate isomerase-like protein (cupin superfamily)
MQPRIKKFDSCTEFYFEEGCYITEISNSAEDPNLSIARARVEPGATTKLHRLVNTIERYVIVEGEGLVMLSNQTPAKVTANDIVIIPAECPQQITNCGTCDLIFLAVCTPRFNANCYKALASLM